MSDNTNYMNTLENLGGLDAQLRADKIKRENARLAKEREARYAREKKSREEAQSRAEKAAAEKRAKIQAESDAILLAQAEAEKKRAKAGYRSVMGSLEGFEAWYASSAGDRVDEKLRQRMSKVPTAKQVSSGEIGPRAHFTPMRFPS